MLTKARLHKEALFADLGYTPHSGQLAIHRSQAPRRVVACGVRWGKTWCAAMEALAAALQPGEQTLGWVVSATYDLSERVFNQVALIAATHLHHRIISLKQHERRLLLRNLGGGISEIRGKSSDNPISLLGAGLDFVIVDEASRLRPVIWESYLSQRLLDRKGWALLISTPKGKGWFYDLWQRGQGRDEQYESWNCPSWTSPHLDAAQIEEERSRLPERVFRQEYGAEFLEGSGAVFRNVREAATGEWHNPVQGERYFAGLDLAKVEDFTVITIVNRKCEVQIVDRFHRLDWNLQINRIKGLCDAYNRATILCDTTGAGEPVYESMRRAGCLVEPYPFTAKSKADLVNNLSILFEQKKITLPTPDLWPDGIDELEAFEYSVSDNGNVRTGAPSGIHDDCVVSLALAAWQARNAPGRPRIVRVNHLSQIGAAMRRKYGDS